MVTVVKALRDRVGIALALIAFVLAVTVAVAFAIVLFLAIGAFYAMDSIFLRQIRKDKTPR